MAGPSVVGLLLVAAGVAQQPPIAASLTWEELRPHVLSEFCAGDDEHEGKAYRWANYGRTGCAGLRRKTPIQRAVAAAFEEARSVLVSGKSEAADAAEQIPDQEARRRAYADALLADPVFLKALLVALKPALARVGRVCSDCPEPPGPPPLVVGWAQFRDYVAAHVWADPVETPVGRDHRSGSSPQYSFHVCAGLNGVAALPSPDPRLVRSAFVAGFDADLGGLARPLFGRILKERAFHAAGSDAAKTEYLRRRLSEEVKRSAAIRRAICRAVTSRRAVLGVTIDPC